jgi:hypothetical protein
MHSSTRKMFNDFTLSPVDGPLENQLVYWKGSTNRRIPPRLAIPMQFTKMFLQDTHIHLFHQGAADMVKFLQDKIYMQTSGRPVIVCPELCRVCAEGQVTS